jgi:acetyl esterase/lipase
MNRHEFLKSMTAAAAAIALPRYSPAPRLAALKTYTYKSVGGCDIKLDVYGSDFSITKPVIVWIHGGALIMESRKAIAKWLSPQNEHVVISIDYRLAPETKLPEIIADVQDAFRWIRQQGPQLLNIAVDKLIVAGGSAGGYLTLMTGFCVKPRPRALISLSGYGNIVGPWYTQPSTFYLQTLPRISKEEALATVGTTCVSEPPPNDQRGVFYHYCRQNGIWPIQVTGHDPATEPRWFDPYCPVRNVTADYPPAFLIHGTSDTDVPYEESANMDKELTRAKVDHRFITVPGGDHGIKNAAPEERQRIFLDALDFVKAHTA